MTEKKKITKGFHQSLLIHHMVHIINRYFLSNYNPWL